MAEEQAETFLYKLEAELADRLLTIVVVAQSDERAFSAAENNILRHMVAPPQIKQLSLVEKKPLGRQGVGYVIETAQF